MGPLAGFEWDAGNISKCAKHGVSMDDIESVFSRALMILPDDEHSHAEARFRAIGKTTMGRHVFLIFTIRERNGAQYVRPISARFMHNKEVQHYEKENPGLSQ